MEEEDVRESGLFVRPGSDITRPPLESGVRDEIRHHGEQLHEVQVHSLSCMRAVQLLCNYRGEGIGVSSAVAQGKKFNSSP